MSLHQRWRERPRCLAPPVTPGRRVGVVHAIVGRAARCCLRAQVVQDGRAARVHDFVSRSAGTMRPTNRTAIGSRACYVFPGGTSGSCIQILPSHHRAFHAGAVLSVVNALRSASTRPKAGPAGIDDACARHDVGYYAMAGFLMARADRESEVDAALPQAYVDVSRVPTTAHPPHRTQCMQSAFPVVALRVRFKRTPQHRIWLLRSHAARERAHT